jgi:hypothetical protein
MGADKLKINILKDEPLKSKEDDRFGYIDIAGTLTYIIKNVKPPFTIGLYGKWGSGKTSICKLVERNLEKDENFRVFYFDVWKYEKDSFRRQFLIELDNKLFEGSLQYREKLNQSLTIPKTLSLKEHFKNFLDDSIIKIFGLFVLITSILVLVKFIITIFPYIVDWSTIELFKKFIDLGLFINLFYFLLSSFKLYQGHIQIHKTDSAEGFEYFYKEILKILGKRKLLVIIDNLDRLTSKKAVSVLSDIKTFLAKEDDDNNSIFLIPCDNEAISGHLHKIYGPEFDADEFLRKFFNLTFKIPKLLDLELDEYTKEKLKETGIPEFTKNYTLTFVITNAFRDNPREIIQFINALTAAYLLAKERNLHEVLNNLGFLAKVLVIRQKWPIEYAEIENIILRKGKGLNEAFNFLKENLNKENDRRTEKQRIKKLEQFLETTSSISTTNIDIFFSLHKTEQEEKLSEWNSFILSALEKRTEDLKEIYLKIKNENKIRELNSLLIEYYRKHKEDWTNLLNIFISIVKILETNEQIENFKEFFIYSFQYLDNVNIYISSINEIDFTKLINENTVQIIPREFYNKFLNTIINILVSTKDDRQPSIELDKGIELFQLISKDEIWANIEKNFYNLIDSLENSKSRFIQAVNVNEIINSTDRDEKINRIITFILNTKPITSRIVPASLNKINEIVVHHIIGENVWQVLEATEKLLNKIQHPDIPDNSYITSVQNFSTTIINRYNQTPQWDKRSILIKIALSLREIKGNSWLGQLDNLIADFIMNCPYKQVSDTISKEKLIKMIKENVFKDAIINRSKNTPDILIRYDLKNYLNEQEVETIVQSLVSRYQYEQILEILNYLGFEVSESYRKRLIDSMINIINQIPLEFFENWLLCIKNLGIEDYPDSIENFRTQLKNAKQRGEEFNNKIKNFVSKNKKLFEGIIDELIK